MNLTKANEIISFIANVGVIGSILFLGLEMRQNTEMIKSQTRDAITEKQMMWYSSLVENEDLAYIWNTSSTEPTLLQRGTPEYYRWSFYILENFRMWENEHYQYQQGLFDSSEFEPRLITWAGVLNRPMSIEWWQRTQRSFSPDFVSLMDSLIE